MYPFLFVLSKSVLALSMGLFCLLVGVTNIVDFNTNYAFVQNVLAMSDMQDFFSGERLMGRAITSPSLHKLFYFGIIAGEITAGILMFIAGLCMLAHSPKGRISTLSRSSFVMGLMISVLVWYLGFAVIGGEWFSMWASNWNGQAKAYQFVTFILLASFYVLTPNNWAYEQDVR